MKTVLVLLLAVTVLAVRQGESARALPGGLKFSNARLLRQDTGDDAGSTDQSTDDMDLAMMSAMPHGHTKRNYFQDTGEGRNPGLRHDWGDKTPNKVMPDGSNWNAVHLPPFSAVAPGRNDDAFGSTASNGMDPTDRFHPWMFGTGGANQVNFGPGEGKKKA